MDGASRLFFILTAKPNDNVVCFIWTKFDFLPNVNVVCLICINDCLFDRKSTRPRMGTPTVEGLIFGSELWGIFRANDFWGLGLINLLTHTHDN